MFKKYLIFLIITLYCFAIFGNDAIEIKNSKENKNDKKHELLETIKKDVGEYVPPKDYITEIGINSAIFALTSVMTGFYLALVAFGESFNGGNDGFTSTKTCVMTPVGVGTISVIVYNAMKAMFYKASNEKKSKDRKRIAAYDVTAMESEKNANKRWFFWAGFLLEPLPFVLAYISVNALPIAIISIFTIPTTIIAVYMARQTESCYDMNVFGDKFASTYKTDLVEKTFAKREQSFTSGASLALSCWIIVFTIYSLLNNSAR
ncbi:MAG: hypothetical protein AB7V16_12260 [Vulcanibacillus sp.]